MTKAGDTIRKETDLSATELDGAAKEEAARDFQSGNGWYRGADVDRLSEEEAGVIAKRWMGRVREKITLTDDKGKILEDALTAQLKHQLTGKATREETRTEMLRVVRQNLDQKDLQVLLDNFGKQLEPYKTE
jgi:hypothetical protein